MPFDLDQLPLLLLQLLTERLNLLPKIGRIGRLERGRDRLTNDGN
jgi:hypothetical protein